MASVPFPAPSVRPTGTDAPGANTLPPPSGKPLTLRRTTERRDPRRRARRTISIGARTYRERRLGALLDRELCQIGAVLHGCRLPDDEYRVDHAVIGPSGLWLVVVDHEPGLVRIAGRGDRRTLTVDGVDQDSRLETAAAVGARFEAFLRAVELDWLDVSVSLCFTHAKWNGRGRSRRVAGVEITAGHSLVDAAAARGPISSADAHRAAARLRQLLVVDGDFDRRS